jgi:SNF2 family DNA or RNA helicase
MLRDDQRFVSDIIVSEKAKLIVAPMGRGKTAAALDGARRLLDAGEVKHVLIIAPKLVANDTWPEEVEAWEHFAELDVAVATGAPEARKAQIKRRAQITILSRDNIVWLWKGLVGEKHWFFDMVIVDESSMFKEGRKRTRTTKIKTKAGERWFVIDGDTGEVLLDDEFPSKAAALEHAALLEDIDQFLGDAARNRQPHFGGEIRKARVRKGGKATRFGALTSVRKCIDRVYELTGTPSSNGLEDLWGQVYLLDQGERLGADKTYFKSRWFEENKYSRKTKPYPWAEKEIMEKIGDLMVSLPPLKLCPDPISPRVYVDLPPECMSEYRRFERELASEQYDVEAINSGVLTNKLLQFANGAMYREDGTIAQIHTAKLDALDELIEDAGGDSVLIFYGFKFDLEQIRKRHPDALVLNETENAVKRWNNGEIKKLLAHPASCAHGLNMQYGGHIGIWFGLTWSLELYQQANARLPRSGQTQVVNHYHIVARDTVDESLLVSLENKAATQDSIIGTVMARLNDF